AEDGIRDGHVTGVQTCALPISTSIKNDSSLRKPSDESFLIEVARHVLAKTHHAEDGEIWIDLGKCFPYGWLDVLRFACHAQLNEIGRASCRERVEIWVVVGVVR